LVEKHGWQKESLMKMRKLDSFIKESGRYYPLSEREFPPYLNSDQAVNSIRKVLKPYTFSNGLTVQRGEVLAAPVGGIQRDSSIWEKADQFNGFRFSQMREKEGDNARLYAANTSTEFIIFGHGHSAWYQLLKAQLI